MIDNFALAMAHGMMGLFLLRILKAELGRMGGRRTPLRRPKRGRAPD